MTKIYVVYGNHGKSPAQLEDYHTYFQEAFTPLGYQVYFTFDPVPGQLNLLVEYFDLEYVYKVKKASTKPGTRFILIATEFITGKTFNDFTGHVDKDKAEVKESLSQWFARLTRQVGGGLGPILFPTFARTWVLKNLPGPYVFLRAKYYRTFRVRPNSVYHMLPYWQDRYDNFVRISQYCEQIWCVTEHQLDAYRALLGAEKLHSMPIISWAQTNARAQQGRLEKDIDILFTGSLTPHREVMFARLRELGFKVLVGPATWAGYMRDHFIARSKICVQVLQSTDWKYPSVMRYHYLLCSGAMVVAEKGTKSCLQEQFIDAVAPDQFIERCTAILKQGDWIARGEAARLAYHEACAGEREKFARLLEKPGASKPQEPPRASASL